MNNEKGERERERERSPLYQGHDQSTICNNYNSMNFVGMACHFVRKFNL